MTGSKFLQRVPAGPQRPSPRDQLALRGVLRSNGGALGALGGTWEDWCDGSQYAADPDMLARCKNNALPCNLAPPWTDAGAGCRQLPKDTLLARMFSLATPPSTFELDPIRLFFTSFQNPSRFAAISAWLGVTPAMLPGIPNAPLAAGMPGIVYLTAFPAMAVVAQRNKGGWDSVWPKLIEPATKDVVGAAGDIASYGLWPGIVIHLLKVEAQNPQNPAEIRVVLTAFSQNVPLIFALIKGPESWKQPGTLRMLGEALRDGAKTLPDSAAWKQTAIGAGDALAILAPAIAVFFRVGTPQAKLLLALDEACLAVLGVRYTTFIRLGADVRAQVVNPDLTLLQKSQGLGDLLGSLAASLNNFQFTVMGKLFEDLIGPVVELVHNLGVVVQQAQTPVMPASGVVAPTGAKSSALVGSKQDAPAQTAIAPPKVQADTSTRPSVSASMAKLVGSSSTAAAIAARYGTTATAAVAKLPQVGARPEPSSNAGLMVAGVAAVAGLGYLFIRKAKAVPLSGVQRRKRRKARR